MCMDHLDLKYLSPQDASREVAVEHGGPSFLAFCKEASLVKQIQSPNKDHKYTPEKSASH